VRSRMSAIILSVALLSLAAGVAVADINIFDEHMGVTLTLGSSQPDTINGGTYRPFASGTFAPTNHLDTIDYVVNDWYGSWSFTNPNSYSSGSGAGQVPAGGEPYDVEAIYFDDTDSHLMVVIVTSFDPSPGRYENRAAGSPLVVTGDLAIDLRQGDAHVDGFRYNYGVNINFEVQPSDPNDDATSGGTTIGSTLYQTSNDDWYLGTPNYAIDGQGEWTNFDPSYSGFGGTALGATTVSYELWDTRMGGQECRYGTYVIEVLIPRDLLPPLQEGDEISLQWVEGCRNDATGSNAVLHLDGDIDVPEPGTLALTGLGLLGLGWWKRRRRSG